jgi:hypothetical protein
VSGALRIIGPVNRAIRVVSRAVRGALEPVQAEAVPEEA